MASMKQQSQSEKPWPKCPQCGSVHLLKVGSHGMDSGFWFVCLICRRTFDEPTD